MILKVFNEDNHFVQVQESPIHAYGMRWSADENIYDAREATLNANLKKVDVMSWWCDEGDGNIYGISFVGGLCSSYNINLNEYQESKSSAGFVSRVLEVNKLKHINNSEIRSPFFEKKVKQAVIEMCIYYNHFHI